MFYAPHLRWQFTCGSSESSLYLQKYENDYDDGRITDLYSRVSVLVYCHWPVDLATFFHKVPQEGRLP
jgi:hypothetical protein